MDNPKLTLFPNAKINLGLDILRKRADGYHDIETLFYPIPLSDILEIQQSDVFSFQLKGIELDGQNHDNLVVKAYQLLTSKFDLPPVSIVLNKQIPVGAGLGGGSADAAFMLAGLNKLFHLNCSQEELAHFAADLGSDCPFFIYNQPMFATGRGEVLKPSSISLSENWLVLIKPDVFVSTAAAYSGVKPFVPEVSLQVALELPTKQWNAIVENRFEPSVFAQFPQIETIKKQMYERGAFYASMSGSGSSVFGLFESGPGDLESQFSDCFYFKTQL